MGVALALFLCVAQTIGSIVLILPCLLCYLVLVGYACTVNFTLPILLFFLPWSALLRLSPDSYSFYTFSIIIVCLFSIYKNRNKFKRYHLLAGFGILFITLLSKLLSGFSLSFDYISFVMLIFLFPVVKEESAQNQYDFYRIVTFFSTGIVVAAICAQQFSGYAHISKYIRVDSYLTITRMAGFYGDPNFYTAQITAALAGGLVMILKEKKSSKIVCLSALLLLLLYCGLLSGSKSFAIIAGAIICLWVIEVLKLRGRTGLKIALLLGCAAAVALLCTSAVLGSLVDVIATRFSGATDVSGFTTGRTDLWLNYIRHIMNDRKLLLLGEGFTNVKIDGRASHNTILQMVFQFGVLGVPFLIVWLVGFYRQGVTFRGPTKPQKICELMLILGTIFPWLAIDALFFDEFFLLQWFLLMGLRQLRNAERTDFEYE